MFTRARVLSLALAIRRSIASDLMSKLTRVLLAGLAAVVLWVATVAASPDPESFLTPPAASAVRSPAVWMVPLPGHVLPALALATLLETNASDSKLPITL